MSPSPLHFPGPEDKRDPVVVPLARAPRPEGPRQTDTSLINRRTLERHWIVVSILIHLAIVGVLVFGLLEPPPIEPLPLLKITLVPQGPGGEGASGGNGGTGGASLPAPAAEATAAQATPEPSQPEIPPPVPEPVTPPNPPTPPIVPPTPPVKEIPPPPAPVREVPPTPAKAETPTPTQAIEVPPPKPRHVPPKRQVARHRQASPQAMPAPAPTAVPKPAPAQTATAAAPGVAPGPSGRAGPGKGSEGIGKGAIGNTAGPGDDYLERLYRHLLRYKKYPPEAIGQKQQGSVTIGFTIARDGTVRDARIEKSSGSPILDRATMEMVNRASPAPPLPDTFKGSEARVRFPIDYKLSLIDQMF